MKFESNSRRKAIEYEKALVDYWKENKTFEKSVEQRPEDNAYVFYDGPPFITGEPHHGTLLSSIIKDAVPRYWTMKGKRVERTWGWDTHGLPAEVFTEQKLGIEDHREIGTKVSLEDYITAARENMVQTGNLWKDTIDRVGRWVDMDNAYRTMDKDYMESVWWAFKQLYEKEKIYEGEKVLMYCTRDATPISKAEVAMDKSYQDVTDPSVYVKFKLEDWSSPSSAKASEGTLGDVYLLACTTTPWTLPSNSAIGVNKDLTYVEAEVDSEVLILAKDLVEKTLTDEKHDVVEHKILREFSGDELVGKSYEPLFEIDEFTKGNPDNAFKVWQADFVHADEGTGIAHESPAYGEEDYELAAENDVPWLMSTDEDGVFTAGEWQGEYVWDINKTIAKTLHERGDVWKIDYIQHEYPHCHRCGTKLMYRAHPSWFMDIDGQRSKMLDQNQEINWFPEHIKNGRFHNIVETAPDWNLSRDRFWATAMPIWKATDKDGKEHIKVVGSYEELKEVSGVELDDYHRPWIDEVTFEIDGLIYTRTEKVLDCWFESGSMPFAQFHYPFENKEKFEANFPGDFIAEYVGQVRAWFYYLHAIGVGLFGEEAFKNVVVTGSVMGNDGKKLSKSLGNYTDPNKVMDTYSADALRYTLLNSPLLNGEDFTLKDKDISDVNRKLAMIWNMYDFFTMYAEVDEWSFDEAQDKENPTPPNPSKQLDNPLDQWIVSRVHQLTETVEHYMDSYDLPNALEPVLPFIDDASNWYVRRSRRRFWRSSAVNRSETSAGEATESSATSGARSDVSSASLSSSSDPTAAFDSHGEHHSDAQLHDVERAQAKDKNDAYTTLHYVLTQLSIVLAPFTPFLSEELYQKLTGGESVHLLDWPEAGVVDEELVKQMKAVREIVSEGLAERSRHHLKVRQPLASATVSKSQADLVKNFEDMVLDELNVKQILASDELDDTQVELDTDISDELKLEGLSREVVRSVQRTRKKSGLDVDDRIKLALTTDDKQLTNAIKIHADDIATETLATELAQTAQDYEHSREVTVDGVDLTIELVVSK